MNGKLIVLYPNGTMRFWRTTNTPKLEELQQAVQGVIELVPSFHSYQGKPCTVFCNEEGKLKGLEPNEEATLAWKACVEEEYGPLKDVLVGPVLICQGDDEFLESL